MAHVVTIKPYARDGRTLHYWECECGELGAALHETRGEALNASKRHHQRVARSVASEWAKTLPWIVRVDRRRWRVTELDRQRHHEYATLERARRWMIAAGFERWAEYRNGAFPDIVAKNQLRIEHHDNGFTVKTRVPLVGRLMA